MGVFPFFVVGSQRRIGRWFWY